MVMFHASARATERLVGEVREQTMGVSMRRALLRLLALFISRSLPSLRRSLRLAKYMSILPPLLPVG